MTTDSTTVTAFTAASVELLDAGDGLATALGAVMDTGICPAIEARAFGALTRWRTASDRFLEAVEGSGVTA
jgi:hypothetical protein